MDFLLRFIPKHYLQLEEQEAAPLACGSESHIDGRVESAQRLTPAGREAFIAALREDATRHGSTNGKQRSETSEQAQRAKLGRSLIASIAIAGIRYGITPKGREALQRAWTFRSKDATRSEPAGGHNGTHG